jgi:hypothetical protein
MESFSKLANFQVTGNRMIRPMIKAIDADPETQEAIAD